MTEERAQVTSKRLPGIFVPVHYAESALKVVKALRLKYDGCALNKTDGEVGIPLEHTPSQHEEGILRTELRRFQIRDSNFVPLKSTPRQLSEVLREIVPANLLPQLPRSFDIIGNIALLELAPRLETYAQEVGRAITQVNPHVRLVLKKTGEITGTYRTRELQTIAGSGSTETVHREFGCAYRLDVTSVYFNPRLARERRRVAQQARPGEVVVDMFAGVGPYSILTAKFQPSCTVYSVDINAAAHNYTTENVLANRLADQVIPLLGDVGPLSGGKLHGVADRVIMNLPSTSKDFIGAAVRILKPAGGYLHYYEFERRGIDMTTVRERFAHSVSVEGRQAQTINYCDIVKEVAPGRVQVAVDAFIK